MDITVIRSDRKTISIQVGPDLSVTVRAPRRAAKKEIEKLLREKESWILRALERMRKKQAAYKAVQPEPFTDEELHELSEKARKILPERTAYYAGIIGVTYGRITIRKQKTRWGSCSSKGNLNFNCLLMLAPPEVIDYVVVHELCHRKEMNHSKAFWSEVENVLPDYKNQEKWLKTEGSSIIRRLRQ